MLLLLLLLVVVVLLWPRALVTARCVPPEAIAEAVQATPLQTITTIRTELLLLVLAWSTHRLGPGRTRSERELLWLAPPRPIGHEDDGAAVGRRGEQRARVLEVLHERRLALNTGEGEFAALPG